MVVAALLREEFHAATVVLPEFGDEGSVVFKRNGLVGGAVTRDQKYAGLDRGEQSFSSLQRLGLGFVVVRITELGLIKFPVVSTALALVRKGDAAWPGTDIAHAVVEIEHANAIRVQSRPGVDVKSTARDAEESRLGGETTLAVKFFVRLFPGRHRAGGAELIAHADIDDVPALFDEAILERLQVPGELTDPQPRLTRRGLIRGLHRDGFAIDGEFFDRGGRGDGTERHSKQSEEDAGHGSIYVQRCKSAKVQMREGRGATASRPLPPVVENSQLAPYKQ